MRVKPTFHIARETLIPSQCCVLGSIHSPTGPNHWNHRGGEKSKIREKEANCLVNQLVGNEGEVFAVSLHKMHRPVGIPWFVNLGRIFSHFVRSEWGRDGFKIRRSMTILRSSRVCLLLQLSITLTVTIIILISIVDSDYSVRNSGTRTPSTASFQQVARSEWVHSVCVAQGYPSEHTRCWKLLGPDLITVSGSDPIMKLFFE